MSLRCFLGIHDFGGWEKVQELPVYRNLSHYAIGSHPTRLATYRNSETNRVWNQYDADPDYVLVGKVVEQRRTCRQCWKVQVDKKQWTV